MDDIKYKIALANIEEIGSETVKKLLNVFNSEKEICSLNSNQISNICFINEQQKNALINGIKENMIDEAYNYFLKNNIKITSFYEDNFPEKLKTIHNCPAYLFYRGGLPCKNRPSVSVIGARMCSDYGRKMAKEYAGYLAKNGVQIISGLASGIDGISQQAAIDNNGKSFGILGCGVDVCYPASNRKLYDELLYKGGIISENPLKSKALKYHFPMRNRIISGLADIIIVIEAKEKSGTAITVNLALEQGREVFALPGPADSLLSLGCNKLIYEGAGIAYSPECIISELENMGYDFGSQTKNVDFKGIRCKIEQILKNKSFNLEQICMMLQKEGEIVDYSIIYNALLELTIEGVLINIGGIYYHK